MKKNNKIMSKENNIKIMMLTKIWNSNIKTNKSIKTIHNIKIKWKMISIIIKITTIMI